MRTPSFRLRILLLVLAVGLVPLGVLGFWLTRSAPRSGERLLRSRLDEGLETAVEHAASKWLRVRSDILFLAEDPATLRHLGGSGGPAPPESFRDTFEGLDPAVTAAAVSDATGRELWRVTRSAEREAEPGRDALGMDLAFGIYGRGTGERLGDLSIVMLATALFSPGELAPTTAGMVLGAFERSSGVSLLPLPLDAELLKSDAFSWGGDRWLAVSHEMDDPPIQVAVAAPLTPFVAPFEQTARQSTWLLLGVAGAGLLLGALVTGRMTRSLEALSNGAQAVARGDLDLQIEEGGGREVSRVARAFNTMTESLKETLAKLAQRESLAAVGEFAASLAHEVRNPLTAIKVDLQSVEERLPVDSPLREAQARALHEVRRLDETVANTLTVARSGKIHTRPLDLADPLLAAAAAARPFFDAAGGRLRIESPAEPLPVTGDAAALEQLFLNLLRNAAESSPTGGEAVVDLSTGDRDVTVSIRDQGPGMEDDVRVRAFEPFFSTRAEGTGLGLPIAQRIASAHDGRLTLVSEPGAGTTAIVTLPLAGEPPIS